MDIVKYTKANEHRGMSTFHIPTEEEIRDATQQGEAAVGVLVGELLQVIMRLAQRVQELEDQLAKNSNNSSKPPCSDGMNKPARTRSLPSRVARKAGPRLGIQDIGWKWRRTRIG